MRYKKTFKGDSILTRETMPDKVFKRIFKESDRRDKAKKKIANEIGEPFDAYLKKEDYSLDAYKLCIAVIKQLLEDLEFAKRTEEALKDCKKGRFVSMKKKEFLKEMEKW